MAAGVVSYEKIPAEIYRQSFATIEAEAELERFEASERELVIRLIHACGMVSIAADVVISPGALEAGRAALAAGAPIICDVEMVRRGVITRKLDGRNQVCCGVGEEAVAQLARDLATTRSAAGMERFRPQLTGAIVAIGNAPTALFHLLEMMNESLVRPALIIGCPVGFVGAVESKEALIAFGNGAKGVPFITLRGRFGGSAIAAAAVNALAGGLST